MPMIELVDAWGSVHRIDTLDIRKIGPWLEEWLPRLATNDHRLHLQIRIYGLPTGEGNEVDWPLAPSTHVFDREGAADLIVTLRTLFGISEDLPSEHDEPAAR